MQNAKLQFKTQNSRMKSNQGFTLIEMIVAVSLFTVVMFVAVGALLAISDANRKATALRVVMENLNFAIESMSRSIRTGTDYSCDGGGNCSGGDTLSFTDQYGSAVTYQYDGNAKSILVRKDLGSLKGITSSEVEVESLKFYVAGVGAGDGIQPRVIITVKGKAGSKEKLKTDFSIQTTVSQRQIES